MLEWSVVQVAYGAKGADEEMSQFKAGRWAGKAFRLRYHSDTGARKRAQGSQIQQEPLIMIESSKVFGHSTRELQSIDTWFGGATGQNGQAQYLHASHWLRTSQEDYCLCSKNNEDAKACVC